MSVPEDQILLEPKIDKVKVTLRGRWSTLNQFDEGELRPVVVELEASDDGRLVPLTADAVQPPPGLRVVSIDPSFVQVEMAERVAKEVAIKPRIVGGTRGSYTIGEVKVTPEKVRVSGPKNVMAELSSIPTEPIDVTGRVRSFKKRIQLRPDSSLINYDLDQPVTVSVPIRAEKIERTLRNLDVTAVNTTYETEISPPTVDLTIRGPRSVVEDVDPNTLHAIVDLTDQDDRPPGKFEKKVEIRNLPADAEVVEIRPTHFLIETLQRTGDAPLPDAESGSGSPSN